MRKTILMKKMKEMKIPVKMIQMKQTMNMKEMRVIMK